MKEASSTVKDATCTELEPAPEMACGSPPFVEQPIRKPTAGVRPRKATESSLDDLRGTVYLGVVHYLRRPRDGKGCIADRPCTWRDGGLDEGRIDAEVRLRDVDQDRPGADLQHGTNGGVEVDRDNLIVLTDPQGAQDGFLRLGSLRSGVYQSR
jgi:hypothetical protein